VDNREIMDLVEALASGEDEGREVAALALGAFGAEAIEPLADLLAGGDADTRWWSARALAEIGGEEATPLLVATLTDADPDVRACAALALGRIRAGEAAPDLAACLADESTFVAGIVADALSLIGEPAVEALAGMLAAEDPRVRLMAVRALARIRSQQAIGPLFGVLEDSSYLVRYYAQDALEALGVGMVFLKP
jgi:HEAT repeat protein